MFDQRINNQKTVNESLQLFVAALIGLVTYFALKYVPQELHETVRVLISTGITAVVKILWVRFANKRKHSK